ncbi:MAG: UDP-4-amino-4,6-dideoxy-N-acetyl-beta-L-altrosamine N-acetyltransferase [Candidatus Eremiobacteraeota bacterium]|nr:UDP-4-amino-4,6-dideoxy-N-acetyl-beta-L-altrosamine N-acetyltransferase [Candidatus Eremiobacteraeota bacterium]
MINLRKSFEFEEVSLINFIHLKVQEREMVLNWRNNEVIRKWMYNSEIISMKEHLEFLAGLKSSDHMHYWLVWTRESGYIGVISLNKINKLHKNAYIGIYSDPDKKGIGTILIRMVFRLAFQIACLHTLKLEVIEDNLRALEFYRKNGFIVEGTLKEFVFMDNGWKNVIIMGITQKEIDNGL